MPVNEDYILYYVEFLNLWIEWATNPTNIDSLRRSKCSLHQNSYNTPTTLAEYIKRKFICTSLFKDMLPTTIREIYRNRAVRYQALPTFNCFVLEWMCLTCQCCHVVGMQYATKCKGGVGTPLTALAPPQFCAYPKAGHWFSIPYVVVFFLCQILMKNKV
jgi:hypothetical protein